ncbi:MAG: PhoH family protein [Bacteroidia bacterium]
MSETRIRLDEVHPVEILGINNERLKLLQQQFPKLIILARGNEIILKGDDDEMLRLHEKIRRMIQYVSRYQNLPEPALSNILETNTKPGASKAPAPVHEEGFLLVGNEGAVIKAKTPNQHRLVTASENDDIVFAVGPAGTGKTYTSVAIAVRALKNKQVKRIVLTRPAVEAGENLGFLPGDLKEKIDPYLRPLYDALDDMIPPEKLRQYMEHRIIEVAPLAFMRGRTLNHAYVILDEAQNTTPSQIKMFLTRMGPQAKFIITGDLTQIDLPRHQKSGLISAIDTLRDIEGISVIRLTTVDVIRHRLVKDIITAYEREDEMNKGPKDPPPHPDAVL